MVFIPSCNVPQRTKYDLNSSCPSTSPTFSAQHFFQFISFDNSVTLKMRFHDVGEYSNQIRRAEKGLDPAKRLYSSLDQPTLSWSADEFQMKPGSCADYGIKAGHIKNMGRRNWFFIPPTFLKIIKAVAVFPYLTSSTIWRMNPALLQSTLS